MQNEGFDFICMVWLSVPQRAQNYKLIPNYEIYRGIYLNCLWVEFGEQKAGKRKNGVNLFLLVFSYVILPVLIIVDLIQILSIFFLAYQLWRI